MVCLHGGHLFSVSYPENEEKVTATLSCSSSAVFLHVTPPIHSVRIIVSPSGKIPRLRYDSFLPEPFVSSCPWALCSLATDSALCDMFPFSRRLVLLFAVCQHVTYTADPPLRHGDSGSVWRQNTMSALNVRKTGDPRSALQAEQLCGNGDCWASELPTAASYFPVSGN